MPLGAAELRETKTTVPAYEPAPGQEVAMQYGLGLYTPKMPGGDWYRGHGGVFGAGARALSTQDGRRACTADEPLPHEGAAHRPARNRG